MLILTLGKFCKTFYKQHIKLATKLTYSKQNEAKHLETQRKAKEKSYKEQSQASIESRTDKDNKVMTDANGQVLPSHPLPLPSHSFHIPSDSTPRSFCMGFDTKLSKITHTYQKGRGEENQIRV